MTYSEEKNVNAAVATIEWLKDEIIRLEGDNEKLEEREKELMDKCDDLQDIIKDLRSQIEIS